MNAETVKYATQYEAVLAAIQTVRQDGGGTVWLCQPDCASAIDEDCDCNPYGIEVPGDDA